MEVISQQPAPLKKTLKNKAPQDLVHYEEHDPTNSTYIMSLNEIGLSKPIRYINIDGRNLFSEMDIVKSVCDQEQNNAGIYAFCIFLKKVSY